MYPCRNQDMRRSPAKRERYAIANHCRRFLYPLLYTSAKNYGNYLITMVDHDGTTSAYLQL